MVPYGLGLLALIFLALFPPTAPWSERLVTPLVALAAGAYVARKRNQRAFGLALLLLGLGDLLWTLEDLKRLRPGLYLEVPYFLGYALLTLALLRLPGKPPRLALALLPLAALGLLTAWEPTLGVDRIYSAWDALLLFLLLPRLEGLFERFLLGRALLGTGLLLFLVADMAYALLQGGPGYPTGHPLHLLWTLGYLLLALGVEAEDQGEPPFPLLALTLGGLFLMPALLTQEPTPLGVRLLALYGGLTGSLGLLYATYLGWRRTAAHQQRWSRFLEPWPGFPPGSPRP